MLVQNRLGKSFHLVGIGTEEGQTDPYLRVKVLNSVQDEESRTIRMFPTTMVVGNKTMDNLLQDYKSRNK